MDELFTRIRKSGYGCHVRHISYAVFGYADDVKLLSPTTRGLQKLLEICETFAQEYNVTFNAEKTPCIRYGKYAYTRGTHSGVMMEGKLLNWHSSITYLGSVLRYDLSDDADIRQKVGIFVSQVNNLNKRFGQLSIRVKSKLMQSYCCSWFGCQTWDITVKPLYSEQSRDPKNVHYMGVFTQEGWDMVMHTCARNWYRQKYNVHMYVY